MEPGKIKEFKIPISLLLMAVTLFFMVLYPLYWFNLVILPVEFINLINFIGNWSYYIFAIAVIGFLYSVYLFYRTVKDRKKFEELMNADSKSAFVKNLRDLEIISRRLGPSFVKKLREKKEELKIKS
jgi:Protein of unknown function (DUF3198).